LLLDPTATHALQRQFLPQTERRVTMNQPIRKNQPCEPKTHLFSPHTDLCVNCGQSAQDDAIENTPCGDDEQEFLQVEPETEIPSLQ
jgi:hypothetical protein